MPQISVIIPVYNTEKYLADCLDSVLTQTLSDIEIICIDDGSTDNSLKILQEYVQRDNRIKIIQQKNMGVVTARNTAIKSATSELIYPLDSDDIITPNTLEKLYQAFIQCNGDIITCRVMQFGDKNTELILPTPNKYNMSVDNCLVNAALFRKSDFEKSGGYSTEFNTALEDYDLWLNMMFRLNLKIYRVPEILFYYRIKPKSESRNEQHRDIHTQLVDYMYHKYRGVMLRRRLRPIILTPRKIGRFIFRIQNGQIKTFKIPVWTINKYDAVISVGAACFVPDALKHLKLRNFSGPFDWMFGSDVITRLNLVLNEFTDYFNADDFEYIGENPDNGKLIYKNIRTGIVYNHDFPHGKFDDTYPAIAAKYKRRTERMIEHLNTDERVLLVFSEFGETGDKNQLVEIMDKINNKFNAKIDLLYVNHNPELALGKYNKPRRISPNVMYAEYYYKIFPTETSNARNILIKMLKKVAK